MIGSGWPEEVRELLRTVPADAPAWNASGYRTIREAVEGRLGWPEATQRIVIETRQYAKRQRTWFRHQLAGEDVTTFSGAEPDWEQRLTMWWKGEETSA
jgi:tRNA dimethylallyltransferase